MKIVSKLVEDEEIRGKFGHKSRHLGKISTLEMMDFDLLNEDITKMCRFNWKFGRDNFRHIRI